MSKLGDEDSRPVRVLIMNLAEEPSRSAAT
jgi:hypothetical protein